MSNLWDKNFVAKSRPRKPIIERELELTELLRLRTVSEIFFFRYIFCEALDYTSKI